jgi:hypothetical protein
VKRVKVALDANIPQRVVRMLNSGFGDQGFEFVWEPDFAPAQSEDEFWATAFRRFGGQITLSADKNIAKRPHQILAFQENKLISFFMLHGWANMDMTFKVGHLVAWWPRIQIHIPQCKAGEAYWVPMSMRTIPFKKVELPDGILKKAAESRATKKG